MLASSEKTIRPSSRQLRAFQPLDRLSDEQRILLASTARIEAYPAKKRILERGATDNMIHYLIDGELELISADGRRTLIKAGSEKAHAPIARLQPRMYDVISVSRVIMMSIDIKVFEDLLESAPVPEEEEPGEMSASEISRPTGEGLRAMFLRELRNNELELPSIPSVAFKVRRLIDQPQTTVSDLGAAISQDPAITAKLIRACNSPLYRGLNEIRRIDEVVARLGLDTTRQLVTVFATREVFRTPNPTTQKAMAAIWRRSLEVAALARVLAERLTHLSPEEAMLAGLLHDIGAVPMLVRLDSIPGLLSQDQMLEKLTLEVAAEVSAATLKHWQFDDAYVVAARHCRDTGYSSPSANVSMADLVIVARLHAIMAADRHSLTPDWDSIPAYRHLGSPDLDQNGALAILAASQDRLEAVKALLSV